ncbi:MAG: hypothetical protein ACYS47_07135 [Planctomycetota bacterium]|jgi:hypothetical protein
MHRIRLWLNVVFLAALVVLLASCNTSDDDGSGPANAAPSASLTSPSGTLVGDISIAYSLTDTEGDPCAITPEYSLNGGADWLPAAEGTGSDGTTALASSAGGTAHTFVWDSVADFVALVSPWNPVRFRITPADVRTGTPGETTDFTVNNAGNQMSAVAITTPTGIQNGDVTFSYTLTDYEDDTCTISPEFSVDGGLNWSAATTGTGGDGTTGLASSWAGTAHTYVWDSNTDGAGGSGANPNVRFRITPNDGNPGLPGVTANFRVDNFTFGPPSLVLTSPSGWYTGDVTVSYSLVDAAGDPCSLTVEYSDDGGSNWYAATEGSGGDGTTNLTSSPGGTPHTYVWDSATDNVGVSAWNTQVRIRLIPDDGQTGASQTSTAFTVNNTGNDPVTATVTQPTNPQTGLVLISYTLTDPDADTCAIGPMYSTNGGSTWFAASGGPGGDGTTGLASSAGGTTHLYVWNSFANGVATGAVNTIVRFRITPFDSVVGFLDDTTDFTVDNTTVGSGTSIGSAAFPVIWNPNTSPQGMTDMATDGSYLYCLARHDPLNNGDEAWSIQRRRLEDGTLDTNWGTGGLITSNPASTVGANDDEPMFIAVDSTSMYVAGNEDASTFGSPQGSLTVGAGSTNATGSGFSVLQPGDEILIGGTEHNRVWSVTSDNIMTLDWTSGSGHTAATFQIITRLRAWRVEKRLLSDGSLVAAFGTGGVYVSTGTHADGYGPVLVTDGASIFLLGVESVIPQQDYRGRIEKISATTGVLDGGFGTAGVLTQNLSALYAEGFISAVVQGGYLYLSSCHTLSLTGPADAVATIEKRSAATGALDTTWATSGVYSDNVSGTVDIGGPIATDGTDLFWMTKTETGTPTTYNWRFVKVNIASGSSSAAITSTSTAEVANQGPPIRGRILLAGSHLYGCSPDGPSTDPVLRVEKRALSDLSLDTTFATSGVYTANPSDSTGGTGPFDSLDTALIQAGVLYLGGMAEPVSGDGAFRLDALFR